MIEVEMVMWELLHVIVYTWWSSQIAGGTRW
jgi:hypothetical protein